MPGQFRWSIDLLIKEAGEIHALGIPAIILFGIPAQKDERGSAGLDPNGIVQRAVKSVKEHVPELIVITDVCIDEYTSHGHCGVLRGHEVDNDATLDLLAKASVSYAQAGADIVAPSDMMDGRVAAIRRALDLAGRTSTGILAYSAKFASAFYGPFRDAVGSARPAGAAPISKATYQMNPANRREALREALLDVQEGADLVMVKPAGAYLDIIRDLREATPTPIAAYQVSGEYAQLHAAAAQGWLDLRATRDESLLAIRRAGADLILTYFAEAYARDCAAGT